MKFHNVTIVYNHMTSSTAGTIRDLLSKIPITATAHSGKGKIRVSLEEEARGHIVHADSGGSAEYQNVDLFCRDKHLVAYRQNPPRICVIPTDMPAWKINLS